LASTTIEEADDLFHRGYYDEASTQYNTLYEEQPSNSLALAGKAVTLCYVPGKGADAEGLAQKAVAMAGPARVNAAVLVKQAHVQREIGKADVAVKTLDQAREYIAGDWQLDYEYGRSYHNNWARYGPAILSFNASLATHPQNTLALYWRGSALHWSERGDGFTWLSDESIANDARVDYFRGLKAWKQENYKEALSHFNTARYGRVLGNVSELESWKGEVYLKLGQIEDAHAAFDAALAINPADALSMHGKGDALTKLGKADEAKTWYIKALETDRLYHRSDYFRPKKPIMRC